MLEDKHVTINESLVDKEEDDHGNTNSKSDSKASIGDFNPGEEDDMDF